VQKNRLRYFFFVFAAVVSVVAAGCATASRYGTGSGGIDYIRPESIETADYAIRERTGTLERQIAAARIAVGELRASGTAIRELSRRSVSDVQGIIDKMEALVLWIAWATDRIQYLENLLEAQGDTPVVAPQEG